MTWEDEDMSFCWGLFGLWERRTRWFCESPRRISPLYMYTNDKCRDIQGFRLREVSSGRLLLSFFGAVVPEIFGKALGCCFRNGALLFPFTCSRHRQCSRHLILYSSLEDSGGPGRKSGREVSESSRCEEEEEHDQELASPRWHRPSTRSALFSAADLILDAAQSRQAATAVMRLLLRRPCRRQGRHGRLSSLRSRLSAFRCAILS